MFVQTPALTPVPVGVYGRLVMFGCATAPLLYTASITFDASGANASTLHWWLMVLSITAVVQGGEVPVLPVGLTLLPNPLVHVAAMSGFVERPTLQSTSWSITTLK